MTMVRSMSRPKKSFNPVLRTSWELDERGSTFVRKSEDWIQSNYLLLQMSSLVLLLSGSMTVIAVAMLTGDAATERPGWVTGAFNAGVVVDVVGLALLLYTFLVSIFARTGIAGAPRRLIGYLLLRGGSYQPVLMLSSCRFGARARAWLYRQGLTPDEQATFFDLAVEWQCSSRDLVCFISSLRD